MALPPGQSQIGSVQGGPQQMMPHPQMVQQPPPMAGGPPPGHPNQSGPGPNQSMPGQGTGGPQPHPPGGPGSGPGPGQTSGGQSIPIAEQPKMDNISKVKVLVPPLKESLMDVFKVAAATINGNNMIDSGSKSVEIDPGRFDRTLEKFFSICDQMEMHLKTSVECLNQGISSSRYLPTPVTPAKMEGSLTYPQYLGVVKGQISFAKEVHDALADAAQKMSE